MAMLQKVEASSTVVSLKKYDVFISFRGEDTRRNFTGHLYDALSTKVITFMDDSDLEKGDEISSSLNKAIEESYASIVIFSKDYASSKWCLNELVKILECKKELGQIVIPVFYGINPSDVRLQRGSFREAFIKHEQDLQHSRSYLRKWKDCLTGQAFIKREHSKDKLQKWKDALFEAADLAGWDYQNCRIESHFIQLIVEDVSKKVNTKLVEIEKKIEKKYEEKSSQKGGIGKTLVAKAINSVEKAVSNVSISCSTTKPYLKVDTKIKVPPQIPNIPVDLLRSREPKDSSDHENELQEKRSKLDKGSPIIIIEAPMMVKTADNSVYCPNFGFYKRGDVGRIVSKKQEDVWAVRSSIGTYIIDGKYFKPLDMAEYSPRKLSSIGRDIA